MAVVNTVLQALNIVVNIVLQAIEIVDEVGELLNIKYSRHPPPAWTNAAIPELAAV